ncbi:Zinc finger CCCH domain-containing protein 48 [Vitis vinifera]|uniref:Zinc finger CCCH domain-containing protein 48 n=1 Tax=Vitis vinifera TaxID=29760 RepID=A0A438HDD2_VITVI|nr:Zinc finger CCCH domain-containing protein 48 [Vitis vinifera]
MDIKPSRLIGDKNERERRHVNNMVCSYWLRGRCNRNPCRSSGSTLRSVHQLQINPIETTGRGLSILTRRISASISIHGLRAMGFFKLAELNGHIMGHLWNCASSGSKKLYTASRDGYIRVWDCHTGQCDGVVNLGGEIGSLISAGPWVFAGIKDVVKAWNIESCANLSLDGPVGQIYAMVNGTIHAWKANKETNAFEPATTLEGHNGAVVSLTVVVWDLDTLQCIHTLKEHASVVMSLVCWGPYLISCSLDQTIKVWFAIEAGNLEVTYTHNEEHGVLSLFGMNNLEGKPILLCSCNDNSVRLYELPSFTEKGRIFAKEEVREIQIGPGGLVFTGDGTGQVDVWKWQAEPTSLTSE